MSVKGLIIIAILLSFSRHKDDFYFISFLFLLDLVGYKFFFFTYSRMYQNSYRARIKEVEMVIWINIKREMSENIFQGLVKVCRLSLRETFYIYN
jgi:hypothetical protein